MSSLPSLRRCRTKESIEVCLCDWHKLIPSFGADRTLEHTGPTLCGRTVVKTLKRGVCFGDESDPSPVNCTTCRGEIAAFEAQDQRVLAGVA